MQTQIPIYKEFIYANSLFPIYLVYIFKIVFHYIKMFLNNEFIYVMQTRYTLYNEFIF